MIALLCFLFAAPVVEGRVGDASAPASGVTVTLAQPDRAAQVVRTGADGSYRFRAFEAAGLVSVALPPGWSIDGPSSRTFDELLSGDVVRLDFKARARRVLRGRVLYARQVLQEIALDDLPAWRSTLRATPLGLLITIDMPAGPAEVTRDVEAVAPRLGSLGLSRVAQPQAERPAAAWIAGKPLSEGEAAAIERLCAVANLDPAFRLVMVARPDEGPAAKAALFLQRYLAGPGMVAPERILFAVGEVARSGQLALILMR